MKKKILTIFAILSVSALTFIACQKSDNDGLAVGYATENGTGNNTASSGTSSTTVATTSTSSTTSTTSTSSTSSTTTSTTGSYYSRNGGSNNSLSVSYNGTNFTYTGSGSGKSCAIQFGTTVSTGQTSFTIVPSNPVGLSQCAITIVESGNTYVAQSGTVTKTIVNNKFNFAFSNIPLNNGGGNASGLVIAP